MVEAKVVVRVVEAKVGAVFVAVLVFVLVVGDKSKVEVDEVVAWSSTSAVVISSQSPSSYRTFQ